MAERQKKPVTPVVKPFLVGNPVDERTGKGALGFFALLILAVFLSFLVSSMLGFQQAALRILLNLAVEATLLLAFYHSAVSRGADAVARGEILYQKQERGQPFSDSERAICFHPMKGYLQALLGTIPFFLCALVLALMAHRQTTGYGTLPGWMSSFSDREDVGGALVAYMGTAGLSLEDVLRMIVRIALMPFVAMVGAENRDAMLLLERLSPVLVLLPACAYGTGYLRGRQERTKIHTDIAESNRKRVRQERKARKARMAQAKGPEQLN